DVVFSTRQTWRVVQLRQLPPDSRQVPRIQFVAQPRKVLTPFEYATGSASDSCPEWKHKIPMRSTIQLHGSRTPAAVGILYDARLPRTAARTPAQSAAIVDLSGQSVAAISPDSRVVQDSATAAG